MCPPSSVLTALSPGLNPKGIDGSHVVALAWPIIKPLLLPHAYSPPVLVITAIAGCLAVCSCVEIKSMSVKKSFAVADF